MTQLSIILPARNEANNLERLLPEIKNHHPDAEIIVVDDGSTDATFEVSTRLGARCIQHPYGMGNGAAIKTGARHASHEVLVMMDADGQHDHIRDTVIPTFIHYNLPLIAAGWLAAMVL